MIAKTPYFRRATIGLFVGAAWIAGLFVARPLVGEFAVVAIAEELIFRSPGWLSTTMISLLGFYAKPVLVGSILVGILVTAAIGAIIWPRHSGPLRPITAIFGVLGTAVLFLAGGSTLSLGVIAGIIVAVIPPYIVGRYLGNSFAIANRRRFLQRLGTVAVAGSIWTGVLGLLFESLTGPQESERVEEPLDRSVSPPAGDPAFDFDGMPAAITRPEDHYVVDITVSAPTIDPESWTLDIDGAVTQPYALSYDDLLDHESSVDQSTTMLCISNPVGGDLIGTSHWTGVQLSELIDTAEPTDEAVDVVTHAEDGYSEAIPLELVEREDILIAYGMGERTLATEHGFPARLLIPGRYGMKMTKWISRIEVTETEHVAYWEQRGWDETAVVNTMSYIRGATREGSRAVVGGVTFGGLETGVEEIAGVEVSVDGGDTWADAELEPQLGAHAWRRWRYEFDAPDGTAIDCVVRAIERDGTVQTGERTSPTPSGATGWHRRTIQF